MAANSKKRSQETKENNSNNNNKKSTRYNILYTYIPTDRAFYKGRILQPIVLCIPTDITILYDTDMGKSIILYTYTCIII